MKNAPACIHCKYPLPAEEAECPLCAGHWEIWEVHFPSTPIQKIREQVSLWLSQLPNPIVFDLYATGGQGLRLRIMGPPGKIEGSLKAWASMMHHQTRWVKWQGSFSPDERTYALRTRAVVPNLLLSESMGDPILAIGGEMLNRLPPGQTCGLRFWLTGKDGQFQAWARALAAYSYGTESGVDNRTPNIWAAQLSIWQAVIVVGGLTIGVAVFLLSLHLWKTPLNIILLVAGLMVIAAGVRGLLHWMQWRSIPKEILQMRVSDTIFSTAITAYGSLPTGLSLLSGVTEWIPLQQEWPIPARFRMPLPSMEIAALIAPPELGEGSGIFARDAVQDVVEPPELTSLSNNQGGIKVGVSTATGNEVAINPDGHTMVTGGSGTGKTSFAFDVLVQLIQQGDDAPGILLVDPHLSLADSILQVISELPPAERARAVQRLRIISPDQEEIIPLNLLTLPDYSWAANALIQIGRRLWEDYWGPRMSSVLTGLFRLAHTQNMSRPGQPQFGLIHTIFAAFEPDWRHQVLALQAPHERLTTLTLDALLGQTKEDPNKFNPSWVTEVISPVISKINTIELSPWLFAALHQNSFADVEAWIREKAWIILRLPIGTMGREGARLTAGVFYNVWDSVYRKITQGERIPYYIFVDEAQEIGPGMRLELMLAEGSKFGARMFVLLQSMSLMRKIDEMDAVVEALLANTSTQAFFSPSPDDALIIRDTLNAAIRYGNITTDLKTLQCWLRARIGGTWQQPVTVNVQPLMRSDPAAVHGLIREVIAAHPNDYLLPGRWKTDLVEVLKEMLPPRLAQMLAIDYIPPQRESEKNDPGGGKKEETENKNSIKHMRTTGFEDPPAPSVGKCTGMRHYGESFISLHPPYRNDLSTMSSANE